MKNGRTQVPPSTAASISTSQDIANQSAAIDSDTTQRLTLRVDDRHDLIVEARLTSRDFPTKRKPRSRERGGATTSAPPMYAEHPFDYVDFTREPVEFVRRLGKLIEQRAVPIARENFSVVIEVRESIDTIRVYLSGTSIGSCEWQQVRPQLWKMVKRFGSDRRPLILLYIPKYLRHVAVQVKQLTPMLKGEVVSFGEAQNEADSSWHRTIVRPEAA